MSILSGAAHALGDVVSPLANGVGAITGANSLTNLGHNIGNPNVTLSNPGGVLQNNNPAFTSQPGSGAYGTPAIGNVATWGTGAAQSTPQNQGANYSGSSAGGGSTGSGGTQAPDPNAVAAYDNQASQIQSGIDRLGGQESVGSQNILDAYNTAFNTLLGQKALVDRNYDTAKNQTAQDNVVAKNDVDQSVGTQISALQRLLGAHGAGSSSAATFSAPQAAAHQGTLQRQQVGQTFAKNNQALDTNFGDYNAQEQTSEKGLAHDRDTQENALKSGIAQNRANLLSQLGGVQSQKALAGGQTQAQALAALSPYQQQSNQLLSQADQLGQQFAHPVLQAAPAVYQAPTLGSYNFDPASAPQLSDPSALTDSVSPYLSLLRGNKDKQTQLIGA